MSSTLHLTNSLSGSKEPFVPLHPPFVGMYQCGPTVYGEPHLGHARPAVVFDVLRRYLTYLGFKVRFVRNITDVGHLEQDADEGEDKIAKKARLEQLEPMEIAHRYTLSYHTYIQMLQVLSPSIEPRASGHIPEQIEMIQQLIAAGMAYESNGSVYFDMEAYRRQHPYGELSGRVLDDLMAGTRELDGQQEKRHSADFALWKKAAPEHIMRWGSPWSLGFPGWHIECSAMSHKYLGASFDIHCGGMDLLFPHHECELAQSKAAGHAQPVKYWVHNNMITIGGQKMGKSLGNFITLKEFFEGSHPLLTQAYSPMTIRLFMLQAHYRSPLDFSNEALQAAEKAYKRILNARLILEQLDAEAFPEVGDTTQQQEMEGLMQDVLDGLNDDLNTAIALAGIFGLIRKINALQTGQLAHTSVSKNAFLSLRKMFFTITEDILGIQEETRIPPKAVIAALMDQYKQAKAAKAYDRVDAIRSEFKRLGLIVKDLKSGSTWAYEE